MNTPTPSLKVAILTGPTATGKTGLALDLAENHGDIEIINADSLLVYKELDIGTAKPTREELSRAPHHLIDILEPTENFTAGDFQKLALSAIDQIHARGKRALITGGTGFYLKALLYGLWETPKSDTTLRAKLEAQDNPTLYQALIARDEESALRIGGNDRYRLIRANEIMILSGKTPSQIQAEHPETPDPRFDLWVIDRDDTELSQRIHTRTQLMIDAGMIDEVRNIRTKYASHPPEELRPLASVGYQQVCQFLDGTHPAGRKVAPGIPGLFDEINLATRQLVKRQRTWFRGQPIARWFKLDAERALIEAQFNTLYPAGPKK